ncbi:MAG: VWA domain-containing protein [Lachnospiraceae bacterium]|nr:VWA domain-containing protein [Lachnospiraceae bacterium]
MSRKIVSLLLAIVMTASMLTGCGKKAALDETGTSDDTYTEEGTLTDEVVDEEYDSDGAYQESMENGSADLENGRQSEENKYKSEAAEADVYADSAAMKESLAEDYDVPRYADDYVPYNGEEYSNTEENPFYSVKENPLSTFSADVDTASYTNIRRMIREGYYIDEIPAGAVRIEEMLNYFSYDLKRPGGNTPFGVTTEVADCPWNRSSELFMVGISTKEIDFSKAPPSNLVFLLDVSGSMSDEDKLPLLQKSFSMLTDNLTGKDRVSIVTYASDVQVILDGAKGSDKDRILGAINGLFAEGGTNGGEGIQTAYDLAEDYFIKGGNNRIILATDGDLNIGLTSEEELEALITKKKESGIFLSVLGFGTGNIKDNKMELLADKGNGNYSYIDSEKEARKVLVKEMGATLMTVAKDVKFQVEFNPEIVESYRLIGYENRVMDDFDFKDDTKDAGEIGAGHSMIALYEIVPARNSAKGGKDSIALKYQDDYVTNTSQFKTEDKASHEIGKNSEYCTVKIRYKEPDQTKSRESEYPVKGSDYTQKPSQDLQFAACVAQFGMLLKNSRYANDSNIEDVIDRLSELDLRDEYRKEFYILVKQAGGYRGYLEVEDF